jgi:hypothetical protein
VDATRTITGLEPGLYAARAARVASGGFSYDPDVTYRDASLSGIQQRTLAFDYELATGAIAVSVSGLPWGKRECGRDRAGRLLAYPSPARRRSRI